jgi:hypothetical protein
MGEDREPYSTALEQESAQHVVFLAETAAAAEVEIPLTRGSRSLFSLILPLNLSVKLSIQ